MVHLVGREDVSVLRRIQKPGFTTWTDDHRPSFHNFAISAQGELKRLFPSSTYIRCFHIDAADLAVPVD